MRNLFAKALEVMKADLREMKVPDGYERHAKVIGFICATVPTLICFAVYLIWRM